MSVTSIGKRKREALTLHAGLANFVSAALQNMVWGFCEIRRRAEKETLDMEESHVVAALCHAALALVQRLEKSKGLRRFNTSVNGGTAHFSRATER